MADLDKNGDENNMMSRAIATDDDADRCRAVVATVILVGSGALNGLRINPGTQTRVLQVAPDSLVRKPKSKSHASRDHLYNSP